VQRESMDGLKTLCLLRGKFAVAAREETTHDDVVGRGADAAPEGEIGRFSKAGVVPNLIQSATLRRTPGSISLTTTPVPETLLLLVAARPR